MVVAVWDDDVVGGDSDGGGDSGVAVVVVVVSDDDVGAVDVVSDVEDVVEIVIEEDAGAGFESTNLVPVGT